MERRLAAILSADVVGYSRLMAADEEGHLAHERRDRGLLWCAACGNRRKCATDAIEVPPSLDGRAYTGGREL